MKTDITFVIDCSGSMHKIKNDMEGALAAALRTQRENPDPCDITICRFSNQRHLGFDQTRPLQTLETDINIDPNGSTALFDALCSQIDDTGRRLDRMPPAERPDRVMFIVITDGEENSSRVYTLADVKRRIEHQQTKYNWIFQYLGANQDAFTVGYNMGFQPAFVNNYRSQVGIGATMGGAMASSIGMARNVNTTASDWKNLQADTEVKLNADPILPVTKDDTLKGTGSR